MVKNNNECLVFESLGVCKYTYKKYIKINGYDSIVNGMFEIDFNVDIKGLDSNSSDLKIQDVAQNLLLDKYSKRLKNCDYKIECDFCYFINSSNNSISSNWVEWPMIVDSLNNIRFNKL